VHGAGRYAPSPTGELHVGNLRTAVLAWLFARSTRRRFLLRIEDLDSSRVRPGLAEQQCADLAALGLTFDQAPVVQSTRSVAYQQALEALADRSYECFCSRREIAEAASAPHGAIGHYPGTCRDLSFTDRSERRARRRPAWRLRADSASMTVFDLLHGEVTGTVDDFVIRRNDGVPAYNLAVVVDDAEQGVGEVVRGADLLDSTPRQLWLGGRLGLPAPRHAHVPLMLGPDGARLAKRHGAVTLADRAAQGESAEDVLSLLAASVGLAEPGERPTPAELVERFHPRLLAAAERAA
jgi:glutamyl-tRNA synthetase